ncbi:benomyl/methotrexate resistance protein [Hypoxylon sp. NC1633]|nr:benomyl/methotrexate resistance protein [Hypoxylon sp. NC1633]
MSTQVRDTEFGHLVRLLSGKKLLRYPDEVDPSLWKKFLQRETGPSGKQVNEGQSVGLQELSTDQVLGDSRSVYLVDWYGPDDPENPQNWSRSIMCMLNFSFYIASSIYVPGIPSIMEEFGVSENRRDAGALPFHPVGIGYGPGPMLWSPISEIPQLGRGPLYFWMFLAFASRRPACWGPPVFGPIIGGFATPALRWRWTIWISTCLCALVLVSLFVLLPETSAATILSTRRTTACATNLLVLGRAFTLTFSEPVVFFMDLYSALLYGMLFVWFESFPLVFGGIYGFSSGLQGLAFLGIFVGALCHGAAFARPGFRPEIVFPPTMVGAVALPVCLFWYGWTVREGVYWILPIVGSGLFADGVVTLFNSVFNYLGISYPTCAASIFAGNAFFRASSGASFPLFARKLFRQLGIEPGNSLLGGIAVCFMPISYIFNRCGEKIRHLSKNARHNI